MKNDANKLRTISAFTLLVLLIFLIYSNTFHASWHFDDKPNILDNSRLHLTDLAPGSLWNTFFAKKEGGQNEFYRPLPSLSFALNWYIGRDNTFGYHLVNIAIHATTAFILYLTTFSLLLTPNLKSRYSCADVHFISFLTAVLWAVNPIQIQAVTYIVQRMAAMAAMFYLLAIYFYIKGRLARRCTIQVLFYTACLGSFLFALMSKENAIILPASLGLVEFVFFQDATVIRKLKSHLPTLAVAGTVLISIVIVLVKTGALTVFIRGYATRPFTLVERLLTEPRIVLFYISQIFFPMPDRFSIAHDVVVSTSLLSPWTTLPSILTILLLIGIGVSQINKRPLAAFAILFFFLNHVIESSLIPLELVFEHRNYLPSLFLFMAVAAALRYLINFYKIRNRSMVAVITVFVICIVTGLGCFTYIRNRDWRTETTLWRDAMKKAPGDARPLWNLAIELAWAKNVQTLQLDVALFLFEKALSLNHASILQEARILRNMGLIHSHRGAYDKAILVYNQGLEIDPNFTEIHYDLISALIMSGKWEEASQQLHKLGIKKNIRRSSDYVKLQGFILLWQKHPEKALAYFRKALKMEPNNRAVLLNTGSALSVLNSCSNAELFLKKAVKASPGDIRPVYALIENSIRAGNLPKARAYSEQMFSQFSTQTIIDGIGIYTDNYRTAPMSPELIIPVIKQKLALLSEDLKHMAPSENASKN